MSNGLRTTIKETFRDEFRRRRFMDNAQVVFVGAVWIVVFVLMFGLSARKERHFSPNTTPKEKPPARFFGPEVPPRKALLGLESGNGFVTVALSAGQGARAAEERGDRNGSDRPVKTGLISDVRCANG